MHEDNAHYDNCKKRERNQGLFTADQASLVLSIWFASVQSFLFL